MFASAETITQFASGVETCKFFSDGWTENRAAKPAEVSLRIRTSKLGRNGFRNDEGTASRRLDGFGSPEEVLKSARIDRGCIGNLDRHKLPKGRGY